MDYHLHHCSKIKTTLMKNQKGQGRVEELLLGKDLQRPFQRFAIIHLRAILLLYILLCATQIFMKKYSNDFSSTLLVLLQCHQLPTIICKSQRDLYYNSDDIYVPYAEKF